MGAEIRSTLQQLSDNDNNIRSQAVLELGKIGDPQAVDALIDILCNDSDLNVVEDVTWALGCMKDAATTKLIAAMEGADATVRHRIVHTLGKFGDAAALDVLLQTLNDSDSKIRYKALIALGQIGDERAIQGIINCLGDQQLEVQQCATDVLEQFGEKSILPLIENLEQVDGDGCELMIGTLGEIGDSRAVDALIPYLHDENVEVQIAAATALGQIGDPRANDSLQIATSVQHEHVRLSAKAALKMIERMPRR